MRFKHMRTAIFLLCISTSSYAYIIQSNVTIENKTDIPLLITIDQPNKQGSNTLAIPAHLTTEIHVQNGDNSGQLYQTSTAPFKIKAAETGLLYVQGRIAYYVGASLNDKYNFLNSVSYAPGLNVDMHYSCKNGSYDTTFENTIVIDGKPTNELVVKKFPSNLHCEGMVSSDLDKKSMDYTPSCFDGTRSTFWQYWHHGCEHNEHCLIYFAYTNGKLNYKLNYFADNAAMYDELNKVVGKNYCGSW